MWQRALSVGGGGGELDITFSNGTVTSINSLPINTWRDTGISASSVDGAFFYYPTSAKYQTFAYLENGEIKAKFAYDTDVKVENGTLWVKQNSTSTAQNYAIITLTK